MVATAGPAGLLGIGLAGSALAKPPMDRGGAVVGSDLAAERRAWPLDRVMVAVAEPVEAPQGTHGRV